MFVRKLDDGIEIWTPAKVNLSLDVLARRDDGFHEIETLIAPISIYDTLRAKRTDSDRIQLRVVATGFFHGEPPLSAGSDNLVVKAVTRLLESESPRLNNQSSHESKNKAGIALTLLKRIPTAAGLGGGSSDAAAALVAANQLFEFGRTRQELQKLAADIGSDVPAFLTQGTSLCHGRGERIEQSIPLSRLHFVVVKPPVSLATADVYANCTPQAGATDWDTGWQRAGFADARHIAGRMSNGLQPSAETLTDWIVRIGKVFRELDLIAHQMSGSGSAYFGICRHATHAVRVASRLKNLGIGRVFQAVNTPGYSGAAG